MTPHTTSKKRHSVAVLLGVIILLCTLACGCTEVYTSCDDSDLSARNERLSADSLSAPFSGDTAFVVLENKHITTPYDTALPVRMIPSSDNRIIIYAHISAYMGESDRIYKDVIVKNDSLFFWYNVYERPVGLKSGSTQCVPIPDYAEVDSLTIVHPSATVVRFAWRNR